MLGSRGLVGVRDEHLVELMRAIHRGDLVPPLDHPKLATAGFLGIAENLEHLRGLDKNAVVAVITAVLAERRQRPRPQASSGPGSARPDLSGSDLSGSELSSSESAEP